MSSAVTKSFGRASSTYGENAHVQTAMADWLARWLPLERAGRALEVGAGSGIFTSRVVRWPNELVVTDAGNKLFRACSGKR